MSVVSFNRYINKVLSYIKCDKATRKRIREDILELLESHYEEHGIDDPIAIMGEPQKVAEEFRVNLGQYKDEKLEYKSPMKLFGLPLLHVVYHQRVTAKGIIAIGPSAIGLISFGGVSVGLFSFGGLSLGVVAVGGLAIAGLSALGGVAIAYDLAIGGIALANSMAMGGVAVARDVAIGGITVAKLMGYTQTYIIPKGLDESTTISMKYPLYKVDFKLKFDQMFPNFGSIKSNIISLLTRL